MRSRKKRTAEQVKAAKAAAAALAAARPRPAFTDGYYPHEQEKGIHRLTRGNTPPGLTDQDWIRAFNNADSKLRNAGCWTIEMAEDARLDGRTRAEAIRMLQKKRIIVADYVDDDP